MRNPWTCDWHAAGVWSNLSPTHASWGFRGLDLGWRVDRSVFTVWGLGFRVSCFGKRVRSEIQIEEYGGEGTCKSVISSRNRRKKCSEICRSMYRHQRRPQHNGWITISISSTQTPLGPTPNWSLPRFDVSRVSGLRMQGCLGFRVQGWSCRV